MLKSIKQNKQLILLLSLCLVLIFSLASLFISSRPTRIASPNASQKTQAKNQVPLKDRGVSYDAFYLPMDISADKIKSDLSFYKSKSVTSIYVSMSERDLINSTKINKIVKIGHQLGLRVYANPYIGGTFSGDEGLSKEFYLAQHPYSEQISRLGLKTGTMPSINDPDYREYLKMRVNEISKQGFDGIEFDEPTAGGRAISLDPQKIGIDYYPYDSFSRDLFKKRYGYDMPGYENADTLQFRRQSVLSLIKELVNYSHQVDPGWVIILVLLPDLHDGDIGGTNNWEEYANIKNLDTFFIDPYWYPDEGRGWDWFLANLNALTTATKSSHLRTGIWARGFGLTGNYNDIGRTLSYAKQRVDWQSVWLSDNWKSVDMNAVWDQIEQAYKN